MHSPSTCPPNRGKAKSVLEAVPIPGLEGVLAPDETLLGEVVSVSGDDVEITTNEGTLHRMLDALHLQRTQNQIGAYLAVKPGRGKRLVWQQRRLRKT